MKIFDFLKNRAVYYITFFCFCFCLYLIIPNSTFMGVLIGLMVSEIQTYFEYIERHKNPNPTEKLATNQSSNSPFETGINWKRILVYGAILLLIWILSNLYLYFTNN